MRVDTNNMTVHLVVLSWSLTAVRAEISNALDMQESQRQLEVARIISMTTRTCWMVKFDTNSE
jgi:hypothetical protein